eukprot:jgi/Ulvmu1/10106/UM006_0056.1
MCCPWLQQTDIGHRGAPPASEWASACRRRLHRPRSTSEALHYGLIRLYDSYMQLACVGSPQPCAQRVRGCCTPSVGRATSDTVYTELLDETWNRTSPYVMRM